MASSPAFFFAPAAWSCSSSRATGSLSSSANWVTFDLGIRFRSYASGLGLRLLEPRFARLHDELVGALFIHAGHLGELIGGEIREGVHGGDALAGQQPRGGIVHAIHALQVLGGVLHRLLA